MAVSKTALPGSNPGSPALVGCILHYMTSPYFLWDYQLTDDDVRNIVRGTNETEKQWLIGRLLAHAQFEDIWKYVTLKDVVDIFPKLTLPPSVKTAWKRALTIWGYHV